MKKLILLSILLINLVGFSQESKKEIIDELINFINYVNKQEITLHKVEQQKEDYKNTYFSKDIKDNSKVMYK